MKLLQVVLLIVMGTGIWLPVASGQSRGQQLVPEELGDRIASLNKMRNERNQTIGSLLLILHDGAERRKAGKEEELVGGREIFAIHMLGLLRAAEAARPLLDRIDIHFGLPRRPWGNDSYVINALAQIGKPASVAAVEYLGKDPSAERARMYVRVIVKVEGLDLGRAMIRIAAEKEMDVDKKARLMKALELFKDAEKPIP